jgi:holo-[acyl-carrier protein] synthase
MTKVSDVAASIDRFGDRYTGRVYTHDEIAYCTQSPARTAERFAARFAAKEATIKVLHADGERPDWRTIEVVRDPAGWCDIRLHGSAATMAAAAGISALSVSLTHDGDYASAVVLAECPSPQETQEISAS